jgi:cyclic beta-1,2-glucan synthetase
VRRLSVTNHRERAREIEVTSYAEIVLVPQADDLAHPAFGKLFVATEVPSRVRRFALPPAAARRRRARLLGRFTS